MTQAIVKKKDPKEVTLGMVQALTGFELAEIALVRHNMATSMGVDIDKVPLLDVAMFCRACKTLNLDPLVRQAHWITRGGKGTLQLGIDGFRAIADRAGNTGGKDAPIFRGTIEYTGGGKEPIVVPEYCQVTVRKIVQGRVANFVGEARWVEFVPDPKSDFMWRKMPRHMLAKCAEAQALRAGWALQSVDFSPEEDTPQSEVQVIERPKIAYDDLIDSEGQPKRRVPQPDPEPEPEPEPEDDDEEDVEPKPEPEEQVDEWARHRRLAQQAYKLKIAVPTLANNSTPDQVRAYNDKLGAEIEQAFMANARR